MRRLFDAEGGGLFPGAGAGRKRPRAGAEGHAGEIQFLTVGEPIAGRLAAREDKDLLFRGEIGVEHKDRAVFGEEDFEGVVLGDGTEAILRTRAPRCVFCG